MNANRLPDEQLLRLRDLYASGDMGKRLIIDTVKALDELIERRAQHGRAEHRMVAFPSSEADAPEEERAKWEIDP